MAPTRYKIKRTYAHIGTLLGLLIGLLVGVTLIGPSMVVGGSVHEIIAILVALVPSLLLVLAALRCSHLGGALSLLLGLSSLLLLLFSLAASLLIKQERGCM